MFARQEPLKEEVLARNAARHQGGHAGRRAGNHLYVNARIARCVNEHLARIRDARHASVGGKRQGLTRQQTVNELRGALRDNVLVTANERLGDAQVRQKLGRHARVFAADGIRRTKGLGHAWAHIAQVTDGRAHHIQASAHTMRYLFSLPLVDHRALKRRKRHASVPCGDALLGLPCLEIPAPCGIKARQLARYEYALVSSATFGSHACA